LQGVALLCALGLRLRSDACSRRAWSRSGALEDSTFRACIFSLFCQRQISSVYGLYPGDSSRHGDGHGSRELVHSGKARNSKIPCLKSLERKVGVGSDTLVLSFHYRSEVALVHGMSEAPEIHFGGGRSGPAAV
jgi:hypothetical protein